MTPRIASPPTPPVGDPSTRLAATAPAIVVEPSNGLFQLDAKAVWQFRELLYFLVWRDVKVRYKQTVIGAAWAILQPLLTMAIFTVIFAHFAGIPSQGFPYPIFAYTGLLLWTYFSQAITRGSASLVGDANLISKVYFPRIIVPASAVLAPLVDLGIAFVLLIPMMLWFGVSPTWSVFALPLVLLLAVATALGVALWLSALHVRYRDVGHTLPFLIQFWMFASPVAYPASLVPEKWRLLYSLNPVAGVIQSFRWTLLGRESPDLEVLMMSLLVVTGVLLSGIAYFTRMEETFADVV